MQLPTAFEMQRDVRADSTAEGKIRWELVATLPNSQLAHRIGDSATEYVSGRFDRAAAATRYPRRGGWVPASRFPWYPT